MAMVADRGQKTSAKRLTRSSRDFFEESAARLLVEVTHGIC